jgi:hypothetical protein
MRKLTHLQALQLLDAGPYQHLTADEQASLAAHLETCPTCRTYAADKDTLGPALSQLFHERWDARRPGRNVVAAVRPARQRHAIRNLGNEVVWGVLTVLALFALMGVFRFLPQPANLLPGVTPTASATLLPTQTATPTLPATPTITPSPVPTRTPQATPTLSLTVTLQPTLPLTITLPLLEDTDTISSIWNYYNLSSRMPLKEPGQLDFTADITSERTFLWPLYWCAADNNRLAENLADISVYFRVDGVDVPMKMIFTYQRSPGGWACQYWATLLSGWPPGQAVDLTIEYVLSRELDDGYAKYPAGKYVYHLTANVVIP